MEKATKQSPKPHSRRNMILFAAVIVVLVAVIGVLAFLLLNKQKPKSNFVSDKPSGESMVSQAQEDAEKNKIRVSMPTTFVFNDSNANGKLSITSKQENLYPFTVTVVLDKTNETVLETGLIPPGGYLESEKLTRELAKGDYPASAYLKNYDDNGNMVSQVGVAVTIRVLN